MFLVQLKRIREFGCGDGGKPAVRIAGEMNFLVGEMIRVLVV